MRLVYHESMTGISVWDADNKDPKFCYPLTETNARTERGKALFRSILASNTKALLYMKHRNKNIRILAHYKLRYKEDILPMTGMISTVLHRMIPKYWTVDRDRHRKKGLVFGG